MINRCRTCLHLFNAEWVKEGHGNIVIAERNPTGLGEARFTSESPCIVIKASDQAPLIWALAQRKCADGAIISFDDVGAHFHIVELKSTIKLGTWIHAMKQFEGMFLSALAAARILQIETPFTVTCYIAGSVDRITDPSQSASPTLLKAPVGKSHTFGDREAWINETVALPLSFEATLVKVWKDASGIADFGTL